MDMERARKGALILLEDCLNINQNENLVIVTDTNLMDIANFLFDVSSELGVESVIVKMQPRNAPGVEPPIPVSASMRTADALMMLTSYTLAPTVARAKSQKAGSRILSLGGYNWEVLTSRPLRTNFLEKRPLVEKIASKMSESSFVKVTTKTGTNFSMRIDERPTHALHNVCHDPGTMGSPPDVEVYVAPLEEYTSGVVFIDGAINLPEFGLVTYPVRLEIENGVVTNIDGREEAKLFSQLLESFEDPNMYRVGELGIGLNPDAELVGNPLIDEGVLGTAHIALGLNYTYGGKIKNAKTHIDCVFRDPTIELDGVQIIVNGELTKNIESD
jgi:leucyl aminopeptidase (aminopeptidase T)